MAFPPNVALSFRDRKAECSASFVRMGDSQLRNGDCFSLGSPVVERQGYLGQGHVDCFVGRCR